MHRPVVPVPFGLCVLSALALSACQVHPSFTVGPDGGTFEIGGVRLEIPAGALEEDVEIGIEVLGDLEEAGFAGAPAFVSGAPEFSVALTPHGQTFLLPLTLSLPFAGSAQELVLMRLDDPEDIDWEPISDLRFEDGVMTASIDHFSAYTLAQVAAGSCPCFNGETLIRMRQGANELVSTWGSFETQGFDTPYFTGYRAFWRPMLAVSACVDHETDSCEVLLNSDGEEAAARWDALFPGIMPTYSRGSVGQARRAGIGSTAAAACRALLLRMSSPTSGVEVAAVATGLPAGEQVSVLLPELSLGGILTDAAPFRFLGMAGAGDAYTVTVSEQPDSVVCSPDPASGTLGTANVLVTVSCTPAPPAELCNGVDDDGDLEVDEGFDTDNDGYTTCGLDGIAGTADDDCDDSSDTVHPGAAELCNGSDDDCDGAPTTSETTDEDADGVPDLCDAHPSDGCAFFTVSEAEALYAQPGAVCLVGATGAAIPTTLQGSTDFFSGVFVEYTADAWEIAGVAMNSSETFVPFGCVHDTTTYCTDNSRPLLPAGSEATQTEYETCLDVAEYVCR